MVRDNRHVSTYIFGAICPARATGAAMIMPYANTAAMNLHLQEISAEVAPGAHAVLVCDGAGWHQKGKKLVVPNNITLLRLPPYSPELNPMENVWDYLRQNKLCAQVWASYEQILVLCLIHSHPVFAMARAFLARRCLARIDLAPAIHLKGLGF